MSAKHRKGILFCVAGPAASGKTTLVDRLLLEKELALKRSISVTSRAPRAGEIAGESYIFVSREDFLAKKSRGEFFESEEIHGNLYGTLKQTIQQAIESGGDLVLVIDIAGARNLKRAYPKDVVITFVVPPRFAILAERFSKRGSGDADEFSRRIATAQIEYQCLLELHEATVMQQTSEIDYLLINDDIDLAYQELRSIVRTERIRFPRMEGSTLSALSFTATEKTSTKE